MSPATRHLFLSKHVQLPSMRTWLYLCSEQDQLIQNSFSMFCVFCRKNSLEEALENKCDLEKKCDQSTLQQTCSLYGLDMVRRSV